MVVLVVCAALARVAVYVADRSLVSDEPFIALNVERHSFTGLAGELDWNQAAPIGFLEIEKAFNTIFGDSEYVLRAAPFIASLAAVALFAILAANVVKDYAVPLAVLIFSGIAVVTSYTAIAKPYAFDVAVVLTIYLSTITVLRDKRSTGSVVLLAALGLVAPLLSYASVFAIAASASVILLDALVSRSRRRLVEVSCTVGAWLTLLLIIYVTHGSTLSHLRGSWPNETVSSVTSLRNTAGNVRELLGVAAYSNYLGYSNGLGATVSMAAALCAALFITVGAVRLLRNHWRWGALLLLPGLFGLVTSTVGWYPIFPRALLFLTPTLAIFAAEGFRALFGWSGSGVAARGAVIGLLALLISAELASTVRGIQSVRPDDGMKPVMNILASHQRPTDTIYLDFASQYAFAHYLDCRCAGSKARRAVGEGLWSVSPVPGTADQWAPALRSGTRRFRIGVFRAYGLKPYYEDFAHLPRHGRVWLILSALNPEQRRALIRRLDTRGTRLMAYHARGGVTTVSLLLYRF